MNFIKAKTEMKVPSRIAPPPPTNPTSWSSSIFSKWDCKDSSQKSISVKKKPPPRPPPPKFSGSKSQSRTVCESSGCLIDWSSPPSSPISTTRSNSDALSVKSFGSDSVNASSGSTSNVESGFEDEVDLFGAGAIDPWSPPIIKSNTNPGATKTWVTFLPDDSKKLAMPTIIRVKPERPKVPKILEKKYEMDALLEVFQQSSSVEEDDEGWSSDSPPMPSCPPPAPPPELLANDLSHLTLNTTAIALFDYHGPPGDLSFRQGDRLNIIRHIDNNWVEATINGSIGTVPINHIQMGGNSRVATVIYQFTAETREDLTLKPGDKVTLLGRINADWVYGEVSNRRGQFPCGFVDHVPGDLPPWQSPTVLL